MADALVLGIDPGTRRLGYGLVRLSSGGPQYVECGTLTAPGSRSQVERLRVLADDLIGLVREFPGIVCVGIEDSFVHPAHRKDTAVALGRAQGIALAVVFQHATTPVHLFSPTAVKQAVTGKGNAKKDQVAECVRAFCGLHTAPDPDAADALAVALTAARAFERSK